jgi:hypothetical protein
MFPIVVLPFEAPDVAKKIDPRVEHKVIINDRLQEFITGRKMGVNPIDCVPAYKVNNLEISSEMTVLNAAKDWARLTAVESVKYETGFLIFLCTILIGALGMAVFLDEGISKIPVIGWISAFATMSIPSIFGTLGFFYTRHKEFNKTMKEQLASLNKVQKLNLIQMAENDENIQQVIRMMVKDGVEIRMHHYSNIAYYYKLKMKQHNQDMERAKTALIEDKFNMLGCDNEKGE